jgi:hypothetical protein
MLNKLFYGEAIPLFHEPFLASLNIEPYRTHAHILIVAPTKTTALKELMARGVPMNEAAAVIRQVKIHRKDNVPWPARLIANASCMRLDGRGPAEIIVFSGLTKDQPVMKVDEQGVPQKIGHFRQHDLAGMFSFEALPNGMEGGRIVWRGHTGYVGGLELFTVSSSTIRGNSDYYLRCSVPGLIGTQTEESKAEAQDAAETLLKRLVARLGSPFPEDDLEDRG